MIALEPHICSSKRRPECLVSFYFTLAFPCASAITKFKLCRQHLPLRLPLEIRCPCPSRPSPRSLPRGSWLRYLARAGAFRRALEESCSPDSHLRAFGAEVTVVTPWRGGAVLVQGRSCRAAWGWSASVMQGRPCLAERDGSAMRLE